MQKYSKHFSGLSPSLLEGIRVGAPIRHCKPLLERLRLLADALPALARQPGRGYATDGRGRTARLRRLVFEMALACDDVSHRQPNCSGAPYLRDTCRRG